MKSELGGWQLFCADEARRKELRQKTGRDRFPAAVPGDITADLMRAGAAEDVQFADNFLRMKWINACDWVYETEFSLTEEMLAADVCRIVFEGVDTFADVYINGRRVLSCEDMFLPYAADLHGVAAAGKNTVRVVVHAIDAVQAGVRPAAADSAAFDVRRLRLRKAQCHFGWDWAPDYKGSGLWLPVYLEWRSCRSFTGMRVMPRVSGEVTFAAQLGYSVRREPYTAYASDRLLIRVFDADGALCAEEEAAVTGYKNLCTVCLREPRLWFPNGSGAAHLYTYRALLLDGSGAVLDSREGRFGVRSAKMRQAPAGKDRLNLQCFVNGAPVWLKGSNWVPPSFMSGAVPRSRYERLIAAAKEAGFNVLRVWGGGLYEPDLFYDLCDEAGIFVWQDFPFACGSIPEEDEAFCRLVAKEAEHQVIRLRDHPCMLLFNGGNEIKQSFAYSEDTRGAYLTDYLLGGICAAHSDIPYFSACPYSFTDWGNDLNSGDCHKCALFECASAAEIARYRNYIVREKPLATEVAMLGPCRMRSLKKFIPPEKLWPINEIWDLHFVGNPYEPKLPQTFARLECEIVSALFGQARGVEDFVKKGMIAHADVLAAEIGYARAHKDICGGLLNWMFNDIWRNGTWAVIDHDLERKPAYYAMKRAFRPVYCCWVKEEDGWYVALVNDTAQAAEGELCRGQRSVFGGEVFSESTFVRVPAYGVYRARIEHPVSENASDYAFARFGGFCETAFLSGYKGVRFEGAFSCSFSAPRQTEKGDWELSCTVFARTFCKSVFLDGAEALALRCEDNYFDMEAGERRTVTVASETYFTGQDITVRTFADEWEE